MEGKTDWDMDAEGDASIDEVVGKWGISTWEE